MNKIFRICHLTKKQKFVQVIQQKASIENAVGYQKQKTVRSKLVQTGFKIGTLLVNWTLLMFFREIG